MDATFLEKKYDAIIPEDLVPLRWSPQNLESIPFTFNVDVKYPECLKIVRSYTESVFYFPHIEVSEIRNVEFYQYCAFSF